MDTTELGRIALRRRLMAMGVSQAYASELSHGKRAPKLELAGRIAEKIGVPVDAWVDHCAARASAEERAERRSQQVGSAMWQTLVNEEIERRNGEAASVKGFESKVLGKDTARRA